MRRVSGLIVAVGAGETDVRDPKKRLRHGLWKGGST
jgi:hypothetical protein